MAASGVRGRGGSAAARRSGLRSAEASFRPCARMLRLLGDQLIRDPRIAVFELLKNAYDADAAEATVTLRRIEDEGEASIVVEDDGSGMTFETVTGAWLEPGTDHRERQRSEGRRSPIHGRLPMGEKGVGRFAVHKLGREAELVTRAAGAAEVAVAIDWDELERKGYLSDAALRVAEREPRVFTEDATGTRITVRRLREPWTRRAARALGRSVTAMTSPFAEAASFRPRLVLDPDPGWLGGLLDPGQALESALFHAKATVDPGAWTMSYEYRFAPPRRGRRLRPRKVARADVPLGPSEASGRGRRYLEGLEEAAAEARALDGGAGIGGFAMELHIFDLDREARELFLSDYRGVTGFLDLNGGIRVYRDGIRVYDYGEPGNDWLGLDAGRVNAPAQRIGNRLVVGAVHLDSAASRGLVEKTNREGFVESPSCRVFRSAVQAAVQHVVSERNRDKETLRRFAGKRRDAADPVAGALRGLRDRVRGRGLLDEIGPYIDRAEREFEGFRETLLVSASAGLTMTVAVHEVEKGVAELNRALDRGARRERLAELAGRLSEVVGAVGFIARRSDRTEEGASDLVSAALRTIEYRFSHHGVRVRNGFVGGNDFRVQVKRRLVVGALLNLFDNAVYWLGARDPAARRLYAGPARGLDGPGILVADNGPGFIDPPDFLVQPFATRKKDGTGLGLYVANEVMRAHGGRLVFPAPGDADLPRGFSGAAVALVFGEG